MISVICPFVELSVPSGCGACITSSVLPYFLFLSSMGKRKKGKGAEARKRRAKEQAYESRRQQTFDEPSYPIRILTPSNMEDSALALSFARGVQNEIRKMTEYQERFKQTLTEQPSMSLDRSWKNSVYGFFGKATLQVEGFCPAHSGTAHLLTQMGVPGCGKTTFVKEFLQKAFSSAHSPLHEDRPSILLTSTTNKQCQELFRLVKDLSERDASIPSPSWYASQQWLNRMQESGSQDLWQHAKVKSGKPTRNSIIICCHDFVVMFFSACYFSVVIIDEVGALELFKGCCILGLCRRLALLLGDPLQGSRPCPTLADRHSSRSHEFYKKSYRCPDFVMKIVAPAYRKVLKDPSLELSGIIDNERKCILTSFSKPVIDKLSSVYGKNLLVMGFTRKAIEDLAEACTVDSAIGLEATVVVLIFERKSKGTSFQYDVRRLVSALTRCTHGLVLMFKDDSYSTVFVCW